MAAKEDACVGQLHAQAMGWGVYGPVQLFCACGNLWQDDLHLSLGL
jgi:hypothetical protein